jgi:hypothetical protein
MATLCMLIATVKLNNVDPQAYSPMSSHACRITRQTDQRPSP